jgi:hypothetical protein
VIRIRSACVLSVLTILTPLGCGDDEELDIVAGNAHAGSGGASGNGGSSTGGGSGGSGGSAGSSGTGAIGGVTGGTGGTAGAGAGGSADGGGAAGSAGADAGDECEPTGTPYEFNWCPALITVNQAPATSAQLVPNYFGLLHQDCRVSALVDTHPDIAQFGNDLTQFTLRLWGCAGNGVTTFELVPAEFADASIPGFTAADIALLIKLYVQRTKEVLALGPANVKLLTDTLTCLAKDTITNPSTTEYSVSVCPPDAGTDDASLDGGTD